MSAVRTSALSTLALVLLANGAAGFTPDASRATFATFGNEQAKHLIKQFKPSPLSVPNGAVMTPQSTENFKRFVRARILLEDPSCGCIASFDNNLCVVLCKFNPAEHQLLLPLWQPSHEAQSVFKDLRKWHDEAFGSSSSQQQGARMSGAHLECEVDRKAWQDASQ